MSESYSRSAEAQGPRSSAFASCCCLRASRSAAIASSSASRQGRRASAGEVRREFAASQVQLDRAVDHLLAVSHAALGERREETSVRRALEQRELPRLLGLGEIEHERGPVALADAVVDDEHPASPIRAPGAIVGLDAEADLLPFVLLDAAGRNAQKRKSGLGCRRRDLEGDVRRRDGHRGDDGEDSRSEHGEQLSSAGFGRYTVAKSGE